MKREGVSALIFDLDRVLVKWQGSHDSEIPVNIIAGLAEARPDNLARTIKLDDSDWITSLAKYGVDPTDRETLEKIDDRLFTWVMSSSRAEIYPWVSGILPKLAKTKKLALLTNNGIKSARHHLGNLLDLFQVVKTWDNVPIDCKDIPLLKPAPDGVLAILQELKIKPEAALILEDSMSGVIAGKKAGVRSALVCWEDNQQESLIKSLGLEEWVFTILRDPNDLLEL